MKQQNEGRKTCYEHGLKFTKICKSPYCNHYRQICPECILKEPHHKKFHLTFEEAFEETENKLDKLLTGLKAAKTKKNQQVQNILNNNPGLFQIEKKIKQITLLLEEKIKKFQANLKKIYAENVKEKLDELGQLINKSQIFLANQKEKLKKEKNLKKFYQNDFNHELKYYESCFQQIFVKNIRSFKTGLENDRILTLIINFEQNIEKIFTISKENVNSDKQKRYHIFLDNGKMCKKFEINNENDKLIEKNLATMEEISSCVSSEKLGYFWKSVPESTYYPINDCYYIFGEGERPSRKIVKYQNNKEIQFNFKPVKQMETERAYFSVCLINSQIYIIGGQNEREGCVRKCEKFVPLYNNQVYIVNSLNQRSSRHSVTTYKNKYILKFGGIQRLIDPQLGKQEQEREMKYINELDPQIYSIESDEWSIVNFKRSDAGKIQFRLNPYIFSYAAKDIIIIFGGDSYQPSKQVVVQKKPRHLYEVSLIELAGEVQELKIKYLNLVFPTKFKIYNSTIHNGHQHLRYTFIKENTEILDNHEFGTIKLNL